jgi:1-aminocyclopropane-1-carboxylate deaminase/D-cysteine desulfhydrase-like pyridoxal-dependent ACC family enzyme
MDNLVRNERLKLLANALDRASTSFITVGGITPLAALAYASAQFGLRAETVILAAIFWTLFGIGLHLLAREVLGGLRNDSP